MTYFNDKLDWEPARLAATGADMLRASSNAMPQIAVPDHIRDRVEAPLGRAQVVAARSRLATPAVAASVCAPDTDTVGQVEPETAADVAAQALDQIVCFTPGTRILTALGDRPIETLQIGDLVVTRDQGQRPIRWIGRRRVSADNLLAPIRFRADDAESGLLVSPRHRVLFTGQKVYMRFGTSEVLVAAKDLVDGCNVTRQPVSEITYTHLMFDHHEVIYANGIATESFHATDAVLTGLEEPAREAMFAIFPDLRVAAGRHARPARTCLDEQEARALKVGSAA